MTLETEMASPAAGGNGRDASDATITRASDTSKSNLSNGEWVRSQGGCTKRGGHQGRGGRGGRFNRPAYTSLIRNFKWEVKDFGALLGTTSEPRWQINILIHFLPGGNITTPMVSKGKTFILRGITSHYQKGYFSVCS